MTGVRSFSKWFVFVAILLPVAGAVSGSGETVHITEGGYTYERVEGDPLDARIYTLDNGLKVYMSVYRDAPRIAASIVVRVGSKNDPDTATGLAHCVEHLMFKGTDELGTANYELENKELDSIAELFDLYDLTADSLERKRIYHRIDSISYLASKYAIAGEYEKVMGALGATRTNANTSVERTVYINEIPSNKVAQWLALEYERFKDPVFRLFHTELAAIREEKNIELDSDYEKTLHAIDSGLWKSHPYGTHTILGSVYHIDHLSVHDAVNYFNAYYVPGNMAVCISGDIDPDSLIEMIDGTFGRLEPAPVPEFTPPAEDPITEPVVKEVWGPDKSMVAIGFSFPGTSRLRETRLLMVADWIMMNSVAGLLDINLKQTQKVISAFCYADINTDYSKHLFLSRPREGQSLEEVENLLLSQIKLLKEGDFPDWLPEAAANILKIIYLEQYSSNNGRVSSFVDAFTYDISWEDKVAEVDEYRQITKEDIVGFANNHYRDNYVVVYKRTGEDSTIEKMRKPEITPIELGSDSQSEFASKVLSLESPEIEPEFLDFDRDVETFATRNDVPVLYKRNTENDLFKMYYVFDMGRNNDRTLDAAMKYLSYLGTATYSNKQLKQELFKQGCLFRTAVFDERMHITISGLGENFKSSIALIEELLANAEPDSTVLNNLVEDILRMRSDSKLDAHEILHRAMESYAKYGKRSPYTNRLSEEELRHLDPVELAEILRGVTGFRHRILYYGPHAKDELAGILNQYHADPRKPRDIPEGRYFKQLPMEENIVYVCDYDMRRAEIVFLSKSAGYNADNAAVRRLFNQYYDGNMGSVVFQTLRESKGLAYSVEGSYTIPDNKDGAHYVYAYISTQADKLPESMAAVYELLNVMPESEECLGNSKKSIINQIRTERITKSDVLLRYEQQKRLGIADRDIREDIFNRVPSIGIEELRDFFNSYIKGNKYTILVLADRDEIDFDVLEQYGEVRELSLEEVFGY